MVGFPHPRSPKNSLACVKRSTNMVAEKHLIFFPFMAQGFIIPFLALAELITKRPSYKVTFVSTPLNVQRLKAATVTAATTVEFAALPFNSAEHGLPPNSDNADSMAPSEVFVLHQASESLRPSFDQFLSDMSSKHGCHHICVVTDFLLGWVVEAATDAGIYTAVFDTSPAYGSALEFSVCLNMPDRSSDADEFLLPDFPEAGPISWSQVPVIIRETDWSGPLGQHWRQQVEACFRADVFLFNTVAELDDLGMDYFKRKMGRPGLAVGPICSRIKEYRVGKGYGLLVDECVEWLDRHPPVSVLYIAFGSWNTISPGQMMELAKGLETSGRPFIWAIRPPTGYNITGEIEPEWLPDGFEARITENGQGILARHWAPQLDILSSRSVGVFISHCGWNSILESLINGVPIISWPLNAEQFYNSKMLVEQLEVSVEIARGDQWEIDWKDVSNLIEIVMGGSELGQRLRKNSGQVKEVMKAAVRSEEGAVGPSVKALDEFLSSAFSTKMPFKMI